jgi:hypothetical protein
MAAKQYQRGICDRNTQILTPYGNGRTVSFEMLHQLFECQITPLEAYKKCIPENVKVESGFALSSQFAVSLNHHSIFCLGEVIGSIILQDTLIKVTLHDPDLWRVEIEDCFRRTGIPGEVE